MHVISLIITIAFISSFFFKNLSFFLYFFAVTFFSYDFKKGRSHNQLEFIFFRIFFFYVFFMLVLFALPICLSPNIYVYNHRKTDLKKKVLKNEISGIFCSMSIMIMFDKNTIEDTYSLEHRSLFFIPNFQNPRVSPLIFISAHVLCLVFIVHVGIICGNVTCLRCFHTFFF